MSQVRPLAQLLEGYASVALTAMGLHGGWFPRAVPKAEMVRRLAEALAAEAHVRAALADLDPTARAVLETVQRANGPLSTDVLVDELAERRLAVPPTDNPYAYRLQAGVPDGTGDGFRDVLARLEVRGLVLGLVPLRDGSTVTDLGLSSAYAVPAEVAAHLPPPPPAPAAPPPDIAREVAGDAEAFGRQLFLAWSHLRRAQPRLLKSGLLGKRDVAALADQLEPRPELGDGTEQKAPRIRFLRRLLQALELLAVDGDGRLVGDERRARALWDEPLDDRAERWLVAWQDMVGWNELDQLPGVVWSPSRRVEADHVPPALHGVRDIITSHASELAHYGGWASLSALSAKIRLAHRDLLVSPDPVRARRYGRGTNRYASWANQQRWDFHGVRDEQQGWAKVEGAVIRQAVEAMHWLGLLDLGLGKDGAVVAFRLTDVGRVVLWGAPVEAASPPAAEAPADRGARVVVQPSFRILAIGPVPETALLLLERFADRTGTDRVLEYALTRPSVYRGQLDGLDAAAIQAALTELSGAPLPQNVERTLDDWQRLHEEIAVHRRVTLLQTADAAGMAALAADGPADGAADAAPPAVVAPVAGSPTLARVLDPARLAARLAALGQAAGEPTDPAAAGSVTLDDDGVVRPRQKLPSLYLLGRLQRLARWDEPTATWRLDADAADAARQLHGLDAPAQAEAWRRLIAGPPPEWLERRLKAWSAHYRPAGVHRVMLVELPSAEALADVLADPRAAAVARRFKPAGPLLQVAEDDLAALGEVLAAFGIRLRGVGEKRQP